MNKTVKLGWVTFFALTLAFVTQTIAQDSSSDGKISKENNSTVYDAPKQDETPKKHQVVRSHSHQINKTKKSIKKGESAKTEAGELLQDQKKIEKMKRSAKTAGKTAKYKKQTDPYAQQKKQNKTIKTKHEKVKHDINKDPVYFPLK